MLLTLYIILPISLIFALLSGFFNLKNKPFFRIVTKTIASLLFVFAGILSLINTKTPKDVLIVFGLICGMIGDIFLSFDDQIVDERDRHFFLFGAITFVIGHIFYIAFFFDIVNSFNPYLIILIVALPILMTIIGKLVKVSAGKMTILMPFYYMLIALMATSTINFYLVNKDTASILALSAGILFVLSDIALMFKNFTKFKNHPFLVYFVLVTYYIAQGLFATMIYYLT